VKVIVLFIAINLPKRPDDEAKYRVAVVDLKTLKKSLILSNDHAMRGVDVGDCLILVPKDGNDRMKIVGRCN
jgi:hypothetical protein